MFSVECGKTIMAESKVPTGTLATLTSEVQVAAPRAKQLYETSLANALAAVHLCDQLRGQLSLS